MTPQSELLDLLDALVDERIDDVGCARLEQLIVHDPAALATYLEFMHLHGTLAYDAGIAAAADAPLATGVDWGCAGDRRTADSGCASLQAVVTPQRRQIRRTLALAGSVLMLLGLAVVPYLVTQPAANSDGPEQGVVLNSEPVEPARAPEPRGAVAGTVGAPSVSDDVPAPPHVELATSPQRNSPAERMVPVPIQSVSPQPVVLTDPVLIASRIDERLQHGWQEAEVEPSPQASDSEWLRRVYLDLAGRIPDLPTIDRFMADTGRDKRVRMVDTLLSQPDYVRNFATIWTNLLIGRSSERPVNRRELARFLRQQFHDNRPWNETVAELVSAEGSERENGAANFLLAHLNNEAVPATAITARLFLCQQIHCTQCHVHPQTKVAQDGFWELNSFFQQTAIVEHQQYDPKTGRQSLAYRELVSKPVGGATYFEDSRGVVKVAYPRFDGVAIPAEPTVNRRRELARLLTHGARPQLAQAFVNRMWHHFFGQAFTDPVDDMGPHQSVSHPELLADLTDSFVASGYDIKQLVRAITLSQAYHLTSEQHSGNLDDDPGEGVPPLFSRMYVKPLTAEQLFDSLLIATGADLAGVHAWEQSEERRDQWLNQLYTLVENEENGEASLFDGSLSQTLLMMNGDLIRHAISGAPGTILHEVDATNDPDATKIRLLCRSALTRDPSEHELIAIRRLLRRATRPAPVRPEDRRLAVSDDLKDVFWAYLNSSEFAMNH